MDLSLEVIWENRAFFSRHGQTWHSIDACAGQKTYEDHWDVSCPASQGQWWHAGLLNVLIASLPPEVSMARSPDLDVTVRVQQASSSCLYCVCLTLLLEPLI